MDSSSFAKRLVDLRTAKGISARDMSISIGQNDNYINKIENEQAFPSMTIFFNICEFLGISKYDFFDDSNKYPERLSELLEDLKLIDETLLTYIAGIVKYIANKNVS